MMTSNQFSTPFTLFVNLFLVLTLNVSMSNAFTVQCTEDYECIGEHIQCLDNEECNVQCSGVQACEGATIDCVSMSHPCHVKCGAQYGCWEATIISSRTNLSVNCGFGDGGGCLYIHIDGFEAQSLVINADRGWAINYANISCPIDDTNNNCIINMGEAWRNVEQEWSLYIYAVNAFRDIQLDTFCIIDPDLCQRIGLCSCRYPTVFCTENLNESCETTMQNGIWRCENASSACNLLDFTLAPTLPTSSPTSAPSISPIYAVPYSRNDTLYVRQTGCDHNDCSSDASCNNQTTQFACKTMNHTLRCLDGEGFVNCSKNNGNGRIDIGEGMFDLNQPIFVKHKHIVFKGVSHTRTVLQHTLQSETVLIHCEYQCYMTVQDLRYFTPNNNSRIEIINGGHMTLQNVVFENYDASISFIIDGVSNVTFVDCAFRNNNVHQNAFTISGGAYVSFKQCNFKNNSFFADAFTVNNSILTFEGSSLNLNTASLSTNLITANGGSLHVKNCIFYKNEAFNTLLYVNHLHTLHVIASLFIANANINSLFYVSNANDISILETVIDEDNQCHDDHYVSILNSNLLIDQTSLSVQEPHDTWLPTASPVLTTPNPTLPPVTKAPTQRPTFHPIPSTPSTNASNITACDGREYCYDVPIYPEINQRTESMAHIQIHAPNQQITITLNFHIKNTECLVPEIVFSYPIIHYQPEHYSDYTIFNNDSTNIAVCPEEKLDYEMNRDFTYDCDWWSACAITNDDLNGIDAIDANSTYSFTINQSPQNTRSCSSLTTNIKWYLICSATTKSPTTTPTAAPTDNAPCGLDTYCYDIPIYPELHRRTEHVVEIRSVEDGLDMYFDIRFISHGNPCTQPRISFEFQEHDFDSPDTEYLDIFDDGIKIAHCTGTADYKYNHTIQCLSERSLLVNEFTQSTITIYKPQ
eukprot:912185_1